MDLSPEQNGGLVKTIQREGSGEAHPGKGDTVYVHYVGTLVDSGDQFDSSRDRDTEFSFTLGRGQNGGLVKTIQREGSGEAHPGKGDTVYVHYVGTLVDSGDQFDSSRDRDTEFSFTLGRGQVIKGWDLGVASMKQGELATLVCAPEYGYGPAGSPPKIPGNASLNFEVELLRWEGEDISVDRDKSIIRSLQTEGEGNDSPNDGASVTADFTGSVDGTVFFEKKGLSLVCGEGSEVGLPEGVDKALKRMKKGETSRFTIRPKAGFGSKGRSDLGVPPDSTLLYDITLTTFEKEKESWQLKDDEKILAAEKQKERGTEFFKAGKLKLAAAKYQKIVDLLQYLDSLEGEQKTQRDALLLAAHLNLSLVYVKKNEPVEAVKQADKALELSPGNVKALYRRAAGNKQRREYCEAVQDLRTVLGTEPGNKAAANLLAQAQNAIAAEKKAAKATFAGMFDKFAKADAKKTTTPVPVEEEAAPTEATCPPTAT